MKSISSIKNYFYYLNNFDNETLTDFVKINENKTIFIFTDSFIDNASKKVRLLSIINIDINFTSFDFRTKVYNILLENLIPKLQLSTFEYNGHLLFSTTVIKEYLNSEESDDYFSLLIIFGYANGTDSIIDLSYYLNDNENFGKGNKKLIELLYENFNIENNIFNYTLTNKFKLVFIPPEIIILNNDELIKSDSEINLDNSYIIKQNNNINKTYEYYYIDYQFIIKEQDNEIENERIFYGRKNRLKFKLCYDYCETCNELGISENNQKCFSCLPDYQYNYDYFYNNQTNINICVPEGYYYDNEINSLILCNSTNNISYIDLNNNKKICYKHKNKNSINIQEETNVEYHNFEEKYNNSEQIYNSIKNELMINYNKNENNYLKITTNNNYSFQLTTVKNQMDNLLKNLKSEFSVIDLKECTKILNKENGREEDADLIILKYENENQTDVNQKSIQYEIYDPDTNNKLDLSVCSDIKFDIYIPIQLKEETQKLYEDLKSQGYNLFDKNDKFYTDICSPFKTKNGTDILLSDRLNEFFLKNELNCQANCEYSDYLPDSEYLKCECNTVNEKIETKNPEKITAKSMVKSFYNTLKYSNNKVLKCYKLVFRKITLYENKGSIISLIYFLGFFLGLIIFCFRNIIYIKKEVSKLFIKRKIDKRKKKDGKSTIKQRPAIYIKNMVIKNNIKNNISIYKKDFDRKKINLNSKNKKISSQNLFNNKKIINNKVKKSSTKFNIPSSNKAFKRNNLSNNLGSKEKINIKKNNLVINKKLEKKVNHLGVNKKFDININQNKKLILTDYELNDLEYETAIKLDNRNFFRIYFYFLKREHIIFFTFFYWNDFNLFSIKLSKFFLAICTDMAFNVFFFSDESMHNLYINGGEHNFIEQLAQMIYSTIASQILQVFINFLTMTDITYYTIKELINSKHMNINQIKPVMTCLKIKIIIFFIFSFCIFAFFCYLISTFCSVYENTQRIFITDSVSSFIMGLIYPFALYIFPAILRILALKSKNIKFLYLLSDKIPFF